MRCEILAGCSLVWAVGLGGIVGWSDWTVARPTRCASDVDMRRISRDHPTSSQAEVLVTQAEFGNGVVRD